MAAITGPAPPDPARAISDHRACITCGYDLIGLPVGGVCPECGTLAADSLRGILLQFASPDYLRSVRLGLSLVLSGILIWVVVIVVSVLGQIYFKGGREFGLIMQAASLADQVLILVGYLRLTVLDPQFTGTESPTSARAILRIAVLIQIGLSLLTTALLLAAGSAPSPGVAAIFMALSAAGLAASAVQFFAMMRYARWLARRVPDDRIIRRTQVYMWLLPLLTTVGCLAIGLGPLVALILYWNLLDRLRKHLKSIERTGNPATLKGMASMRLR